MIATGLLTKLFGSNVMTELRFIRKYYHFSLLKKRPIPFVIFSMDGKNFTNGFADRLRGIITAYAYAKANDLPFRIDHTEPFKIEEYYAPNEVNWLLNENEKDNNIVYTSPLVLLDYTKGRRLLYLPKWRQYHIFANINAIDLINKHFNTNYSYSNLFRELFKPSDYLLESLLPFKKYVQEGYISVSFRFMQLMGDFKDVRGIVLGIEEQNELILKCHNFLHNIRKSNPTIPYILVTSDSTKFMESLKGLDYVFYIPGKIGHIGYISSNEIHLKTMQDFYMISKAKKAFMGYTGGMYKSHFAKSAADTTGIPYEAINF